jgi:hypothetical protein
VMGLELCAERVERAMDRPVRCGRRAMRRALSFGFGLCVRVHLLAAALHTRHHHRPGWCGPDVSALLLGDEPGDMRSEAAELGTGKVVALRTERAAFMAAVAHEAAVRLVALTAGIGRIALVIAANPAVAMDTDVIRPQHRQMLVAAEACGRQLQPRACRAVEAGGLLTARHTAGADCAGGIGSTTRNTGQRASQSEDDRGAAVRRARKGSGMESERASSRVCCRALMMMMMMMMMALCVGWRLWLLCLACA